MKNGVIYIATGEKYVKEVCDSAIRLKKVMPDVPITFFSDRLVSFDEFEKVVIIEPFHKRSKIPYLVESPYDRTLYLDSDTYVDDDFSELFLLLDRFDIAVRQAPHELKYRVDGIPDSFPELQAAIILYQNTPKVYDLFRKWKELYERDLLNADKLTNKKHVGLQDQPSFREAVYFSDVRLAPLPAEYNCLINNPGFVVGKVKIFHGRFPNYPQLSKRFNQKIGQRAYLRVSESKVRVMHRKQYIKWRQNFRLLKKIIDDNGFSYVTNKILNKIILNRFSSPRK